MEYEWNTWRMVRGIRKDTQKKHKGVYKTASIGDNLKELNDNEFLINRIKRKVKSTQNVDVKITGWKWREKCGMSNDVH